MVAITPPVSLSISQCATSSRLIVSKSGAAISTPPLLPLLGLLGAGDLRAPDPPHQRVVVAVEHDLDQDVHGRRGDPLHDPVPNPRGGVARVRLAQPPPPRRHF